MKNTIFRIIELHSKFVEEFYAASKFDERNFTVIPTLLFTIGLFLFTHTMMFRNVYNITSFKLNCYRTLGFHWTIFYVMRIWFLILKALRWTSSSLETHLKKYSEENRKTISSTVFHNFTFVFVFLLGLLPSVFIVINIFTKRNIPNFLLWIGEDPWLRTEIGLAGHYLDRPPNFVLPKRNKHAYRLGRSCSYEDSFKKNKILRNCKSLEILNMSPSL